ncbi:MAG: hypothetical protein GC152_12110 [Alphaproteobacteria bacterium]|nr:hypothetical protein [Alphaproteobacteria bacterium]
MRQSIFDYVGNLDTLIAVVVGALLATGGALVAEIIQDRLNRRRRERDAARFFGEILSSIDRILDLAFRSHAVGDPWGPVTLRLYRTALREAEIYERNRERLFDIRNAELRTRVHTHFMLETFPIQAMADHADELKSIEAALDAETSPARIEKLKARDADIRLMRDRALGALQAEHNKTDDVCRSLEGLARVRFVKEIDAARISGQTALGGQYADAGSTAPDDAPQASGGKAVARASSR